MSGRGKTEYVFRMLLLEKRDAVKRPKKDAERVLRQRSGTEQREGGKASKIQR